MEGSRLGRYRIMSKLAEGGMGAVYLAMHELMGREVIVKVLLPQLSMERDIIERFFNEARAMGNLNHPGIVAIFDLDFAEDGRAYIVMERLQGETLHQRLRRVQRMSVAQAVDVTRQLASALGAAHGRGVVHRDLKPSNIFLCEDPEVPGRERVKVLDFGVAKLAQQQSAMVTRAGAIVGTPGYMAPEQCRDSSTVDHRADLYALGCIMYGCLCGRPPFVGDTVEVLAAQLRDAPAPPRALDPSLPTWLDELILRLLEKDPGRRLQSCAQLVEALDRGLQSGLPQQWMAGPAGRGAEAPVARVLAPVSPALPAMRPAGRDVPTPPPVAQGPASTTFSMASASADVPGRGGGSRRGLWLGIGGSALIALGAGIYLGLARPASESPAALLQTTEITPGQGPAATGASALGHARPAGEDPGSAADGSENGAAEPTPPASADVDGAVQALLDEARAALERKDWAAAASKAQEVLQRAPGHAAAGEIVATAEQEQANALQYREFEQALKMRDFDRAESRLAALPESSVYREPARAKLARARGTHQADLQRVMERAQAWRDAGKCADIRALQAAWAEIESELTAMIEQCEQASKKPEPSASDSKVAAASAPVVAAPVSPGSERKPAPSGSSERKPAPSGSQFDELLAQAREALNRKDDREAFELCKKALEIKRNNPDAGEVCAIASCNRRNAAQARAYYAMTSGQQRRKIHGICLSKSIVLGR
jgi:tRNA A-37 threonylcarbamoyl transferase component Bud32